MIYWVELFGLYLVTGILYAVVLAAGIYIRYARIYGVERTTQVCEEISSRNKEYLSWKNVPLNLALWPYSVSVNMLDWTKDFEEIISEGTF